MVWYNLKIGIWNIRFTGLNPIEKEYPYCDKDGNELKKVSGKFEKGYFINEKTNEKHDTAFRLINGKPFAKLQKTKEVKAYKEVELSEVEDLLLERQYLVECDTLLNDLLASGKALKFGFTNGNGFKVFKAYLYPSQIYKGFLFMSCGTTQISELVREVIDENQQKKKLQSIELSIQGVNRASVEELIQI